MVFTHESIGITTTTAITMGTYNFTSGNKYAITFASSDLTTSSTSVVGNMALTNSIPGTFNGITNARFSNYQTTPTTRCIFTPSATGAGTLTLTLSFALGSGNINGDNVYLIVEPIMN